MQRGTFWQRGQLNRRGQLKLVDDDVYYKSIKDGLNKEYGRRFNGNTLNDEEIIGYMITLDIYDREEEPLEDYYERMLSEHLGGRGGGVTKRKKRSKKRKSKKRRSKKRSRTRRRRR